MPIYLMETSKGTRLIEAANQKAAINFVMRSEVTIKPLNAVGLAEVLRKETIEIEQVAHEEEAEIE